MHGPFRKGEQTYHFHIYATMTAPATIAWLLDHLRSYLYHSISLASSLSTSDSGAQIVIAVVDMLLSRALHRE
jgi:hypothetical protein